MFPLLVAQIANEESASKPTVPTALVSWNRSSSKPPPAHAVLDERRTFAGGSRLARIRACAIMSQLGVPTLRDQPALHRKAPLAPIVVSLIAFVIILGGAFVGTLLRKALPSHHLADDAKDVVRLGAGLVGTIAALVLGLLIASAKSSYDTQSKQVQHLTTDLVLLDQLLAQYGPEARPIRDLMRQAVGPVVRRLWGESVSASAKDAPYAAVVVAEDAFARIAELAPQTDAQRSLKARAVQVST